MGKKAQVLIISIWILAMLTILAIGIGHRVSTALYLSQYHKDKLAALYLAKAAVNLAVTNIQKDNLDHNSLRDLLDNNLKGTVFSLADEESKININTCPKETLIVVLEKFPVDNPREIADNILIWRGDIPDSDKVYENLGYARKGAKFTNAEELKLVKGITDEIYQGLKVLVTVHGKGMININTVPNDILTLVMRGIAGQLNLAVNFSDSVTGKIIARRNESVIFRDKEDVDVALTDAEEINIFNKFMENAVFSSDNFLIEAAVNVGKIDGKVEVVYNRSDEKFIYWYES